VILGYYIEYAYTKNIILKNNKTLSLIHHSTVASMRLLKIITVFLSSSFFADHALIPRFVNADDRLCAGNNRSPLECKFGSLCKMGTKKYDTEIFPETLLQSVPEFQIRSKDNMYCDCNEYLTFEEHVTGFDCGLVYSICPDYHVCLNEGTCEQQEPRNQQKYRCRCPNLFLGDSCEFPITNWCSKKAANSLMYCANNGECVVDPATLIGSCSCPKGYYGKHCEFYFGEYDSGEKPCYGDNIEPLDCKYGGTCLMGSKKYEAEVFPQKLLMSVPEFQKTSKDNMYCDCGEHIAYGGHVTGLECELEYTVCPDHHVCLNESTCVMKASSPMKYSCECTSSFLGDSCEFPITERCNGEWYCANYGKCYIDDENSMLKCSCPNGYKGDYCEVFDLNSNSERCNIECKNGGTCWFGNDSSMMHCKCLEGYAGDYCEHEDATYCVDSGSGKYSFCANNGVCKSIIKKGEEHPGCDCVKGFFGKHCVKIGRFGAASKAFIGFSISLLGLVAIYFVVIYLRRGPKRSYVPNELSQSDRQFDISDDKEEEYVNAIS